MLLILLLLYNSHRKVFWASNSGSANPLGLHLLTIFVGAILQRNVACITLLPRAA